tara:strand:+ start:439 stop:840 length:402 start_codon:yes stop_codon:yes gene_type:complete
MDYDQRIDNIRIKLNIYNNVNIVENNTTTKINSYFNTINTDDNNLQDRLTKITELAYCNEWNRLHIIHKKIKLEEFINSLNNYTNLDDIKKQLIELLNNKKILKKHVIYDKINGKLLDILILEKDNTLLKIKI